MSSPREYFDKDSSQNLRVHAAHTGKNPQTGEKFEIIAAVSLDFEAGAKFASLYVPDTAIASLLVEHYLKHINDVLKVSDGVLVESDLPGANEPISSADLSFTGRLFTYTPYKFTDEEKARLSATGVAAGIRLILRDGSYCEARSNIEEPLAFICHKSRDRDPFVRELAATLQKMLCPVSYDQYSIRDGQSLQASIEKGLRECRKCILVLSPSFLDNSGWEEGEFDSVFTREILELQDVIIPIWHGVSKEDVYAYSPRLLNRPAISSSVGTDELARRVMRAINCSE